MSRAVQPAQSDGAIQLVSPNEVNWVEQVGNWPPSESLVLIAFDQALPRPTGPSRMHGHSILTVGLLGTSRTLLWTRATKS